MYANYQKDYDELKMFVKKGKDEEWVDEKMVASGPTGHLYVAVANLLDYANSETTSDEEVKKALKLAKRIAVELT